MGLYIHSVFVQRLQAALSITLSIYLPTYLLQMHHFLKIGLQCLFLLSLWLLLLPVLIGILFEYVVIIPARVPLNETPFVPPYEAWALGLVFLKIWVRCELLGVMVRSYLPNPLVTDRATYLRSLPAYYLPIYLPTCVDNNKGSAAS